MNDPNRVEFDATLEEIADVNMRLVLSTDAYRRGRRQSQWTTGLIVAGVLAVTLQDHISPTGIAALSALSGFLCASLYGAFHERGVRQSYVRVVRELYGDAATVQCAFELRDDAFWGKTGNMEVSFPWSDRVSVNDKGDCLEVWSNPGLAVVRNRAFHSDSERQVFVETVRRRSSR
jgi:hypothetical protein